MASSCSQVSYTVKKADKLYSDGYYNEAILTLYDHLSDEEIADSAMQVLVPALQCSRKSDFFDKTINRFEVSPENQLSSAEISADGRHIVTTELNKGRVCVYSFPDMKLESEMFTPCEVYTAKLDPTGKKVVAGCIDGGLYIFDYPSGEPDVRHFITDYPIRDLYFTKDGRLFTVSNDCTLCMIDYPSDKKLEQLSLHTNSAKDLDFSTDEKMLCTASNDGTICVLRYDGGKLSKIGSPINICDNYVNAATFSPDGKTVVSGDGKGFVRFFDVKSQDLISADKVRGSVLSLSFNSDGSKLAAGTNSRVYILMAKRKDALPGLRKGQRLLVSEIL